MKVKNDALYALVKGHTTLDTLMGIEFIIKVNTNVEKAKAEIKVLDKIKEESPEIKELRTKESKLYLDYSELDDNGEPKVQIVDQAGGQATRYTLDKTRQPELISKVKELNLEYKDSIAKHKTKLNDFNLALGKLSKDNYLELVKADLPSDITKAQYDIVAKFVKII